MPTHIEDKDHLEVYHSDHEKYSGSETHTPPDEKGVAAADGKWVCPADWAERLRLEYSGNHEGETLPAGSDVDRVIEAVMTFSPEEAVQKLEQAIEIHHRDLSFMEPVMDRIKLLVQGHEAAGLDYDDWRYTVCKQAGLIFNWSPYPEVRSVTLPYDDPEESCETLRAWVLGIFWCIGCTIVDTFFGPRQPGISIPASLVQLVLVPMGQFLAWVLPDWGFRFRGKRYTLNPGPWTAKEQLFATVIMSAATSGNQGGLLAMRMPQFFDQKWVGFGFEICLGLANQCMGLGSAGLLRRLTMYPVQAVWPQALPLLALNRTLVHSDNKREIINGWKMSRWLMFMLSSIVFVIWYWFPNNIMQALQRFDWMVWIKPSNFSLNIVTGAWGGMGFNPISTFDPNYSGNQTMASPFFAQMQQYIMRIVGGIVIMALYYSNYAWGAFLPINSGGTFTNTQHSYNTSIILNPDNSLNETAYRSYSPPYYSSAALFKTGGEFAWYTITIVYVFIRYFGVIKRAVVGAVKTLGRGKSTYDGFEDPHTRMLRKYKEVPEWWFLIVLLLGFMVSVIACEYFPTDTPWWSILAFMGIGYILLIPWCITESIAATGIGFDTLWHLLPGLWWPGKLIPQLMIVMLGSAFDIQAGAFMQDLKYVQYAHMPPRSIFRGHIASVVISTFFYIIITDWLVTGYNTGSFCDLDDPQKMVCAWPRQTWSNTIFYGLFGTRRMFKLYPILPWCFLIGALIGLVWALGEIVSPKIRDRALKNCSAKTYATLNKWIFNPVGRGIGYINPAIALSGMMQWSNQNNLSMATTGIYLAWFFQYYLKRKYTAWWSKYAYLVFAGLSVGITISGLISTLVFSFGAGKGKSIKWWGNSASSNTINWLSYQDKPGGSLMHVANGSYFGVAPEHFP